MLTDFQNITGSNFNDSLDGDIAVNVINGGAGDDSIAGRGGADTLDGGAGTDIVDYSDSVGGVNVTLGAANVVTTGIGGDAAGDKIKNFEGILGSDFNDTLKGNAGDNIFIGGLGADTLTGGAGADKFFYTTAAQGNDTITDFVSGIDSIVIAKNSPGFMGGLPAQPDGALDPSFFVSGANAAANESGHGQFIFDTTSHSLYWDSDGTDSNAAVLIAKLNVNIVSHDILLA